MARGGAVSDTSTRRATPAVPRGPGRESPPEPRRHLQPPARTLQVRPGPRRSRPPRGQGRPQGPPNLAPDISVVFHPGGVSAPHVWRRMLRYSPGRIMTGAARASASSALITGRQDTLPRPTGRAIGAVTALAAVEARRIAPALQPAGRLPTPSGNRCRPRRREMRRHRPRAGTGECHHQCARAQASQLTDWSPLAGRQVAILRDEGERGAEYASKVTALLSALSPPPSLAAVRLPGLSDGEDIEQWVARRRDLARRTRESGPSCSNWSPLPSPDGDYRHHGQPSAAASRPS